MGNFTEVEANDSDVTYLKPAELTTLEGTFLGIEESQYGPNYKIELADGSITVLNGCGALNKKMIKVQTNSEVKFEHLGMKPITSGPQKGKEFHDIKVLVANVE